MSTLPGTTLAVPSVLVMARSATGGVTMSVSVAVLLAGLVSVTPAGAVTVAVLLIVPVADGLIWAIAVKVTVPPGNRSTVVAILPVPPGWADAGPGRGHGRPAGGGDSRREKVGDAGPDDGVGAVVGDDDGVGVDAARHDARRAVGLGDGQIG